MRLAAPRVNVVCIDNGAGLSRDARLVLSALADAGVNATWSKSHVPKGLRKMLGTGSSWQRFIPRFDVNLFLERFDRRWFPHARCNVLVPNPEWFMEPMHQDLPGIDLVLGKSRQAVEIFSELGKKAQWIGFSGVDQHGGELAAAAQPLRALHLAGRSIFKGTDRVVALWRKHPEWPQLTVVQRPHVGPLQLDTTPASNIRFLTERLRDDEIVQLQRRHAIHILPSEVEGYGQTLIEGLSVGAVVVTTDAAPMNELVQSGRGALVSAHPMERMQLGLRVQADEAVLEAVVGDALSWSVDRRVQVGAAARRWYVDNDVRFRTALPALLRDIARSTA